MNDIRKEKLRIVILVDEINERGIAHLTLDLSGISTPVNVKSWSFRNPKTLGGLKIERAWSAYSGDCFHPQLRKIRHDLEQMLKAGKATEVAA